MNWPEKAWNWLKGLVGNNPENPSISATQKPQIFYHGTQTAIHLLPNAYLDPQFASGGDEGDPQKPHVFVTQDKLMAKIFALKAPNVTGINITENAPIIVFSSEPKNLKGGWVYTCPENPKKPFEELIVRGWHTNKWVSYDKVPIVEAEYVPSLQHLMQRDNLQVYIVKDGIDLKTWNEKQREAAYDGELDNFYAEQIKTGNVRHLNAEMNIIPAAISYRDNWSQQPRNQMGRLSVIPAKAGIHSL